MATPHDPTPACPPDDILEILAAGGSTDVATRTHTDTCARCQSLLDELRSHAAFVAEYLEDIRPRATGLTGAGHPHAAAETELDVSPDLVPGYRILAPIHRGGQGVVYRALHEKTKRTVAIKMLLAGHFADARQRQRFEREAELAALLKHPNLVTIYDTLNLRGGRYAIVMEYIEGSPLDQWKPPGTNDRERIRATIRLFVEICSGLQHAHSNAIIHRDLKPSNVLVDKDGRARIVDFGIARSLKPDDAAITHTGEFTGTRQFASPEQIGEAMGKPARSDARSDVYSLGVMLFAVLCARLPYDVGDSIFSSAEAILNAAPARPTSIRPAIGKDLETIILKALQKEPDRRYETAISLGRDLERYLTGDAIEARRDSTWYVIRKALRRNRVPLGIAAAVAIAAMWVAVRESGLRQLADDNAAKATKSAEEAKQNEARAERQRTRAELNALANQALNEDFLLGEVQNIADSSDPARVEEFVWHLFLKRTFDALDPSTNDNRKAAALWWMRELHRRQRCVFTTAFSDKGPLVGAVNPADGVLTLCDNSGAISKISVPSGAILASFAGPASTSSEIGRSVSPDGRWIAISTADSISVVEVETGKLLATPALHSKFGGPPAFLPDSRILLADDGGGLSVFDPRRLSVTSGPRSAVSAKFVDARCLPLAATDAQGVTRFWNGQSADWSRTVNLSDAILGSQPASSLKVCSAPGSTYLAAIKGADIHLFDGATATPLALLHARTSRPVITFLPGGDRFLLSGRGSTICLCSSIDGSTLDSLLTHANGASVLGITPDGRYVATSDSTGRLKFWDLQNDPWRVELDGHSEAVLSVRFADDAHVMSCAGDGRVLAWDLKAPAAPAATWSDAASESDRPTVVSSLAVAPGGAPVFVAGYDRLIRRLASLSDATTPLIADLKTQIFCLALSPDSTRLAAACDDGDIAILDASTLQTLHRWHAHEGRVTWVSWSGKGDRLASSSTDRTVIAWDAQKFIPLEKPYLHAAETRGTVFSEGDGYLYSVSDDGALRLQEILGKRPAERSRHDDMIYALAASPRSRLVATGGREGVILWYGPQLAYLANLELPPDAAAFSLDFSPDGSKLAAGTQSGAVYVWDLARFDRAIASNLEYHVARLQKQKRIDEPTAAAARAWAAKVLASDSPVEPTTPLPQPLTPPVPPPASSPAP